MPEWMKEFLLHWFTWWTPLFQHGPFPMRLHGELVGHDELGNAYYRKPGIDPALGFEPALGDSIMASPKPRRPRRAGTAGSITRSTHRRRRRTTSRIRGRSRTCRTRPACPRRSGLTGRR